MDRMEFLAKVLVADGDEMLMAFLKRIDEYDETVMTFDIWDEDDYHELKRWIMSDVDPIVDRMIKNMKRSAKRR